MAGDTNSNIFINIDTSQAMTQLRLLEKELTTLNRSLIVGTKAAAQAQSKYAQSLLHNVNATGQWSASITRMSTASEQFANNLDRQRLSLKEYFRYGMASTKTFGKMFGSEFDTLGKLVDKRVKTLQQQYVQLGRDAQGAMNAMKFTPKSLNMNNLTTQLMMATQKQQILNKLIDDGSTKLLNFGKNTQWAGRQLMVGFTIPLMLFGAQAIKTFKDIETQTIRFKKVYGDIFTDQGATDVALKNIRALANEYTKYGLTVSETIKMAADAAAAGFSGKGLEQLVEQTNKLAVLGGVTQEKALETTIALKNAFQIDTGAMAGTIDFLNAVENQTVVALDDLTEAIPRVAPVIQQLGGDVKDLAYFMAAMQEGGISAAQGANALKSGLASLINPSNAAAKAAAAVGVNIKGIVEENAGNLRNTVTAFAQALQPLTDLERTRVIERVFGKFQFARISALLNNLGREGTQAARVLQLTNSSVEELAILSQREMKVQADSPMNKLAGAVEKLKVSIAPVGELFAKVFTPVIEFIARMAEKFNNLPEGIKKAIGIITVVVGGLGPIFLMTFGLLANAVANSVKGVQVLRKGYQQLAAGSTDAALKTQYLSQEELENISISNALYTKHQQLSAAYQLESAALSSLTSVYRGATAAMTGFAGSNPGLFVPGRGGMPKRFAEGTTSVPGPRGAGDVVPSMLSPGEAVIPVKQSQKYSGFINQIIQDKVPGFMAGRVGAMPLFGAAATAGRASSRRGAIGTAAPVIPISSGVKGITFSSEGSKVRVSVGDESFLIPASKVNNFKKKLKENEDWMIANKRTDNTEQELIRTIKRKGYGGQEVTPSQIYSRLPKFSNARNSQQNQDIADKRFKALLKSKNPHLIKLQNYLQNEEKVYLERVLGPDIVKSLKGFDANKLTPSHIREVRSQNRTPGDWAASKIARDWGWFNSALRGTKFGNVRGGHPLNAAQARELLDNLKMTPFDRLPNDKKALQAALEYRLSRQPSYYDDFIFTDNAMMKVKPMNLAEGIVSVPGPKGAGDVMPAMLSPGEAVIPAKQSAKYMPLIRSMVADKVPGYAGSNIEWDGSPSSLRPGGKYAGPVTPPGVDSWGDPIRPPATSGTRLRNALTSVVRDKDINAVKNFTKETAKAAKETKVAGKVMDGVKKAGSRVAASLLDTEKAASGTTDALGKDKTRGFRGFLGGYGNVSQTVTNDDGTTRAATAAERTNARQMNRMNFQQRMMPAQMAGMMIPMAAGMYAQKNPESGIAKNMDAIMMLSMLTMLLPMLNSPLKMLAATAVGLTVIFKMQAATIRKNVIEGQKQAESMSMTTKNLEELGKITGKVSITQVAQAQRAGRNTDLSPVSIDFGKNLIDSSDFGKKLKSTFESSLEFFGEGPAVNSLVNQLGTAVSQGVLSVDQAESIAVALTRNLSDARLEVNVRGRLIQLLGPNGENVLENPLQLQLDLLGAGEKVIVSAIENLNKVAKQQVGINTKGEVGQLVAGGVGGGLLGARAGFQAADMMRDVSVARGAGGGLGTAIKAARAARAAGTAGSLAVGATGVGALPGIVGVAISTVIFGGIEAAIRNYQKGKEKAAIGKAAGIVQGLISENLAASQGSIDALTSVFNTSIANLELKKKTLKTDKERAAIDLQIADLEIKRQDGLKTLRQEQAKMLADVSASYDQVAKPGVIERISPFGSGRGQVRDKFMEAFSVGMQDKFKDNAPLKAQAAALQSQLDQLGKDEVTIEISTLVTSDVLTPNEASTLLNTLTKAGGNISKNLEAFIDVQGTEGLQRLSTILTMIESEENKKELLLAVELMDKPEADAVFNSIEELGKIPPFVGIDLEIETDANDIDALEARGKEIDKLKGKFPDGKVTLEALIKMQEEAGGVGKNLTLDSALKYWDQISKLDKNVQLQAIITVSQIEFSDSFDEILDRELDAAFEKANPKYAGQQMFATDERRKAFQRQEALDREAFKNDKKNRDAARKAAMDSLIPKIFPTAPVSGAVVPGTGKDDGKAKKDYSWLNDLGQRLKLVKEGAFDALNPLKSIRDFYSDGGTGSINPMLAGQAGAIKQIEAAAKKAGLVLNEDFMQVIRSMDAEQFVLWSKTLFEVGKKGRITGLKDDFVLINNAMTTGTIGSYIDDLKSASREVENQVKAHQILTDEGYNSLEIQKILQNKTLTAAIAEIGFLSASTEERKELNAEIQKTIDLNYKLSSIKLKDNIAETNMQIEAFKRLTAAGVKHEVILEILKDKNNAWAIGSADATVDIKDKFGDLINNTKKYSDLLELIRKQTLTFEQASQEAIDANLSALDLQQRTLQNQFDLKNFELKANIKIAEGEVEKINKDIEKEQKKIDAINFTLKYDTEIGQTLLDDLQEQISDAQRKIEFDFERPIQGLQDRSTILSNDLTLIDKAAEEINEKYDKQEEALSKISQLNSDIAAQEKSRISLADALSQGDISAAAQMAQEMRTSAAEAASRRSGDLLAEGRKFEIDNLRSGSGMTKAQIQAEQFRIEQQIFALEQQSKIAKQAIIAIEDRIYNITELREAKLLDIRNIETIIDGIRNNQLLKAQEHLDKLTAELAAEQAILDAQIAKIDLQKLKWEEVQLKLDAYKAKLKSITDGELTSMLDMINKIAAAMATLSNPSFKATSAFVPTPQTGETAEEKAAREKAEAEAKAKAEADAKAKAAADAAINAAAASAVGSVEYALAVAAGDMTAAAVGAAKVNPSALAAKESGAIGAASIAAQLAAAEVAVKNANTYAAFKAKEAADAAKAEQERLKEIERQNSGTGTFRRPGSYSNGGLVTQYMAFGGKVAGYRPTREKAPTQMAYGGMVPKYMAVGGKIGSDTVPAMLTPGEFVMNKGATKAFGPMLAAINGSKFPSMLGGSGQSSYGTAAKLISNNFVSQSYPKNIMSTNFTTQSYPQMSSTSINPTTTMSSANVNNNSTAVYNYSVGINVGGSNTNPQDIARAVMTEIKNVDAQRIRSQRA